MPTLIKAAVDQNCRRAAARFLAIAAQRDCFSLARPTGSCRESSSTVVVMIVAKYQCALLASKASLRMAAKYEVRIQCQEKRVFTKTKMILTVIKE